MPATQKMRTHVTLIMAMSVRNDDNDDDDDNNDDDE